MARRRELVYLVHDHGGSTGRTRTPFNSVEEATAQGAHDGKYGFGIPVAVEAENGAELVSKADLERAAASLE